MRYEGRKSISCDPDRPAFLGDVPITFNDALNKKKRWSIGLLEVGLSEYSPAAYGVRAIGLLMGLAYAQYHFGPFVPFQSPHTLSSLSEPFSTKFIHSQRILVRVTEAVTGPSVASLEFHTLVQK
ncbi:unnamed protein product [Dovyalis caffra]|uniref:Uncharacterized protein n=1 Tax=Dovyalis caffra TaxID=77055 RepID=A0AAV1RGN1_9ROSI|nr:unnamed protein product [Dovyalis caffra]